MCKKVNVLLSTYNGEKYIGEQLNSILKQTYQNIEIYVRDDGSTDGTLEILKSYEKKNQIHLEIGKNVGFIKSFFWLICNGGEADYYAFCDQDDSWIPEKIEMALEKLSVSDEKNPVLYFSNYDFYDGELNFQEKGTDRPRIPSFPNCLVDCISLGINSVFNQKACEMMRTQTPQASCGHDWWTYMICQGMGQVIYDERSTVKYRRHGSNVSAGGMNFFQFQIWRFKKFFVNDYFDNVKKMLQEYEKFYGEQLRSEDQRTLKLFTGDHYHFITAMKKVFYPKKFRQGFVDEMMIRCIFLIGKL